MTKSVTMNWIDVIV